jgi:hypothetical protein
VLRSSRFRVLFSRSVFEIVQGIEESNFGIGDICIFVEGNTDQLSLLDMDPEVKIVHTGVVPSLYSYIRARKGLFNQNPTMIPQIPNAHMSAVEPNPPEIKT